MRDFQIRPIETEYHGCRFRSRLEARWAVFFDALEWIWDYEPEGFEIPGIGGYLPDFEITNPDNGHKTYFEVKPIPPTPEEVIKLALLGITDRERLRFNTCYIAVGAPSLLRCKFDPETEQIIWNGGRFLLSATDALLNNTLSVNCFASIEGGKHISIWPLYFHARMKIEECKWAIEPVYREMSKFCDLHQCEAPVYWNPQFPSGMLPRIYMGDGINYHHPFLMEAYNAATSARFEFGENGSKNKRKRK